MMKIQLLIATTDKEYGERLSSALSKLYPENLQSSICSNMDRLLDLLSETSFDQMIVDSVSFARIHPHATEVQGMKVTDLVLVQQPSLWCSASMEDARQNYSRKIEKYQRVSFLVQEVLKSAPLSGTQASAMPLTVVWSPAGGTGKTSTALAYAAKKTAQKKVVYLDLDFFSSSAVYFNSTNRGISWALQQLEESNGEVHLEGILEMDNSTGIRFFGPPENFDDIHILTVDHLKGLLKSLSYVADEVVVDLPTTCNLLTKCLFEEAARILVVVDTSVSSKAKLEQFITQNSIFSTFSSKMIIVANKGTILRWEGASIKLPFVKSTDDKIVFKTLATQIPEM